MELNDKIALVTGAASGLGLATSKALLASGAPASGGAPHRLVLPASALIGALVLIWSDALARTAFAPAELPLGVLTALLGTPLLVALVHRISAVR